MTTACSNRWYDDTATQAKFLLGGIGTGNFSVGSRGQLCDWEIFGPTGKGNDFPYTFFAIRTEQNQEVHTKILESELKPPYEHSHGYASWDSAGIPRFTHAKLCGEVSRGFVELEDDELPVTVNMTAFSPFIPLDSDSSGIPAAIFRYCVKNSTDSPVHISIAASLANAVGFREYRRYCMLHDGTLFNEFRDDDGIKGLFYDSDLPDNHLKYGSMALATSTGEHVTSKPQWMISNWWDGAHDFWNDFIDDGMLVPAVQHNFQSAVKSSSKIGLRIGSLCVDFHLNAQEEKEIEFCLSWFFPNRDGHWAGHMLPKDDTLPHRKKYYSTLFTDAWDVCRHFYEKSEYLEKYSDLFRKAIYETKLPADMLDAMTANITVLRSTTCMRLENGTFLGWEGTYNHSGSCEGNCSHVWNYQQTLAFLFPDLERSMRRTNFLLETDENGEMSYRSNAVFGFERYKGYPPAADGQMGTIVQLYRDWKLSGDDDFLRELWDKATAALDFAFTHWDTDGDFVFDSVQHNTYDIEFYGSDSLTNSCFYAALKAGAEMAEYLGDKDHYLKYTHALEAGSRKMDELLYNGEYYIQINPPKKDLQYQYGEGCLSDQVLGQELAHIAGLGYILPREHVSSAIHAVFKYNYRTSMQNHLNVQRTYALGDEAGLICCTWPNTEKPDTPFVYSDEVWSGIEYQVATHLIYEGYFSEACTIVSGIRNRYNGIKRNPWNEVECGNHYVRSMASWGLLIAASGYRYDMTKKQIHFQPNVPAENFNCFFSTGTCWGVYRKTQNSKTGETKQTIEILYGSKDVQLI